MRRDLITITKLQDTVLYGGQKSRGKKEREDFLVVSWVRDTTSSENIPRLPHALGQKEGNQQC